ncbi:uncharacterized protein LOC119085356 [Bradysia coprophila]|uniref:uncharacterized protein LOC119085356 n=1 Tax=Bradysia coprophila TaxID=38358 RepID=UPI00187DB3FE|nr:uncharacterized protein LOC119085356 [Bradysia coprophila]
MKNALIVIALAYISTVSCAQNYMIDFNNANLTTDFDRCTSYNAFRIESYQDKKLDSYRNGSETFLSNSVYGGWMCLITKSTFTLERDAKLSTAINVTSQSGTGPAIVEIRVLDMDSGMEYDMIETETTNQWKLLSNTVDKRVENAKIDVMAFVSSGATLAIEYIEITNPQQETTVGTSTEVPTEASTDASAETPIEIIVDKNWKGSLNASILFKLIFSFSNSNDTTSI